MTNAIANTFHGQDVRHVLIDGEPWFVLGDICAVLGVSNVGNVRTRIDQASIREADVPNAAGYLRQTVMVNESGLYEVVIRSDKPDAVAFRRWITAEVLPAIRKTGGYSSAPALTDDELIHRALTISTERVAALTEKVAELAPKAEFFDELMDAEGMYSMQAVAKMLGFGPNILFREARRAGILQGNNLPYQRYEHHFKVIPGTYKNRKTGDTVPTATTKVRPSGVDFLRKKLAGALV